MKEQIPIHKNKQKTRLSGVPGDSKLISGRFSHGYDDAKLIAGTSSYEYDGANLIAGKFSQGYDDAKKNLVNDLIST